MSDLMSVLEVNVQAMQGVQGMTVLFWAGVAQVGGKEEGGEYVSVYLEAVDGRLLLTENRTSTLGSTAMVLSFASALTPSYEISAQY